MLLNPRFTFEKVRFDQETDLHLVLNVTAPKSDWQANRPPLFLIPVLDRSGSMTGPKLEYAKRSMDKLVDHLTADDTLGMVSFSTEVTTDLLPKKMTAEAKAEAKKIISQYKASNNTFFSGGMLRAIELANSLDLPDSTIVRIIMFTDGRATHGVTAQEGLLELIEKQAGRATLSMFGYGTDVNQELLDSMAVKGKGNYAFVKDPDSALGAFGKELGGLLSTYAQELIIELTPHTGHQLLEVISDFDVEEVVTGEARIKVPHILSEETLDIVVHMKLAAQKQPGPRQVNAVDVKLSGRVLGQDGKLNLEETEAKAKIQFVKAGEEQAKPTQEVDELVARAQLVKAQVEAESAAKRGDYGAAALCFDSLDLNERGHVRVAAMSTHMKGMYAAAPAYAASGGNRTSLRRAMNRAVGVSALADSDQVALGAAGFSLSNDAQHEMERLFMEPDAGLVNPPGQVVLPAIQDPPQVVEPPKVSSKLSKQRRGTW